jgi:hypothetical protein
MAAQSQWRFLLVDVDGTLLDSQGRISARNLAVLREAVSAGLTLVLATGRTAVSLLRVVGELDFPFHRIVNGGAIGLAPDHVPRYTRFLPAPLWPRIVESLLADGLSPAVFAHRHPEPPEVWISSERGNPHFESYVSRNRALVRIERDLPAAELLDVVEVAALGSGDAFDAASSRVRARFAEESENHTMVLFIAAQFGKITEFFAPGVSKWNAFTGMFPEAAARPESVIAIGDEANDHEMIASAGLGIAMGNAIDSLKAVARQVTTGHDQEGLAEALEPILAGMRRHQRR